MLRCASFVWPRTISQSSSTLQILGRGKRLTVVAFPVSLFAQSFQLMSDCQGRYTHRNLSKRMSNIAIYASLHIAFYSWLLAATSAQACVRLKARVFGLSLVAKKKPRSEGMCPSMRSLISVSAFPSGHCQRGLPKVSHRWVSQMCWGTPA